jgi:hypothetical protein
MVDQGGRGVLPPLYPGDRDVIPCPLYPGYQACGQRVCATCPPSYRRNGMSIFVRLLYSGYAWGKVDVRFRSSTVPL